jgi:hypothetical protein
MNKQERAEMYRHYLEDEGYKPVVDSDGDVIFKKEGGNYLITIDERDEEFFSIMYPAFWKIESEAEGSSVLVACNHANSASKVAKVFRVRDNVWAASELFLATPDGFKPVFERAVMALQHAVRVFGTTMRKAPLTDKGPPNALDAEVEDDLTSGGKITRTSEEVPNAASPKP